jgi:hypothetical protein
LGTEAPLAMTRESGWYARWVSQESPGFIRVECQSQPGISSSLGPAYRPVGKDVQVTDTTIHIILADGRTLGVPIAHWAFLANATPEQRQHWRFTFDQEGIWWDDSNEGLSIAHLLGLPND